MIYEGPKSSARHTVYRFPTHNFTGNTQERQVGEKKSLESHNGRLRTYEIKERSHFSQRGRIQVTGGNSHPDNQRGGRLASGLVAKNWGVQ